MKAVAVEVGATIRFFCSRSIQICPDQFRVSVSRWRVRSTPAASLGLLWTTLMPRNLHLAVSIARRAAREVVALPPSPLWSRHRTALDPTQGTRALTAGLNSTDSRPGPAQLQGCRSCHDEIALVHNDECDPVWELCRCCDAAMLALAGYHGRHFHMEYSQTHRDPTSGGVPPERVMRSQSRVVGVVLGLFEAIPTDVTPPTTILTKSPQAPRCLP